jgi:hypothetical protein
MGRRWERRAVGGLATAVVGLAGLALFLGRLDSTPDRSLTGKRRLESQGIALVLPPSWSGQASHGSLSGALPWFDASRPGHARFTLAEVGNPPGSGRFPSTRLPISIGGKDLVRRHPEVRPGWKLARRLFSTNGRSFSLLAHYRDDASASTAVTEINRVLNTLVVRRPPGTDAVTRARLERPLRLPKARSRCPLSRIGRSAPHTGFTLGGGPAYPVLGSDEAVADLRADARKRGWYLHKTLWAVSPEYPGPLLVRGARLDRPGPVRFHLGGPLRIAVLWSGSSGTRAAEWRYSPTSTALRAPGCYAFQIDGTTFSRVVVFEATL